MGLNPRILPLPDSSKGMPIPSFQTMLLLAMNASIR